MEKEALIIDDLHHKYDNQKISNWILNAINLKIEKGQLLGLLGPSGCGKTTLFHLFDFFKGCIKLYKWYLWWMFSVSFSILDTRMF